MEDITITCSSCDKSFVFRHPSVRKARDMMNIIIDCEHCGTTLKAPTNSLTMAPLAEYMATRSRQLRLV